MNRPLIAIWGATSHIAKGLIYHFLRQGKGNLHLYTRSPERLKEFIRRVESSGESGWTMQRDYGELTRFSYDVIINCVGVGTWKKMGGDFSRYFTIPERYDNLALDYLAKVRADTLYVSFSSGAVYGPGLSGAADRNSVARIPVNRVTPDQYYGITRIYTEAKHRSFDRFRMVDLRVFSYFSRFMDLDEGYFIGEVLSCLLNGSIFRTGEADIVRDYVHPRDLFSLIVKCMEAERINSAIDVRSARPVTKFEILEFFSSLYGLKYQVTASHRHISATGKKDVYYSQYDNASQVGYEPRFTSMDTIRTESAVILEAALKGQNGVQV